MILSVHQSLWPLEMDSMSRSQSAILMKKRTIVIRRESEEMKRRILLIRGGYKEGIPGDHNL